MRRRRRLRKTYVSTTLIFIFILIMLLLVSVGYSLWSSKLNISGEVTLNMEEQALEMDVQKNSLGNFVSLYDNQNFEVISENYVENVLTTVVKINSGIEILQEEKLNISFEIKNVSENAELYSDGIVELVEYSGNNSITDVAGSISEKTVMAGDIASFNFSALVDLENINSDSYYKYRITYMVDGVKKSFYYVLKILPE